MAVSTDGEAIVTGTSDKTLLFRNMFSKASSQKVSAQFIHWGNIFFNGSHFFKLAFVLAEIYRKYLW
jgi:hypothetical protein